MSYTPKPNIDPETRAAASAMGRRGKGRAKTLTPEQREARKRHMENLNAQRATRKNTNEINGFMA